MSKRDVVILCGSTPSESDRRAHQIAAYVGADVESVLISAAASEQDTAWNQTVERGCTCLVVTAETLASAADAMPGGINSLGSISTAIAEYVFVYGFESTARHRAVLRALSCGTLDDVQRLQDGDTAFGVATGCRQWCGPLSGLSLGQVDPAGDLGFVEGNGSAQPEVIVRAGPAPFLVRVQHRNATVFFAGCSELENLDAPVERQARVSSWFSNLFPMMMVLRGALGDRVWHNEAPRACVIIDDPTLKNNRYGFLDFTKLIDSMRRQRYCTCIAFIPWNGRRSSADVAALFASNGDVAHLCVHGCDHTRAEFATTHGETLIGKAQLALDRMREHRRLSGITFDDVMVFPQGLFSEEAIAALKATGYLAAVNSDVCPSTTATSGVTVRDLLDAAVTRFGDFPVFGRHYPRDLAEIACDLFLGKPALIVEHHGYFRDAGVALESFVARLRDIEPRLEWSGVGTICSCASLIRRVAGGDVHVRFYASRFSLENAGPERQHYVLSRRQMLDDPRLVVKVNGRDVPCERAACQLTFRLSLEPGTRADVRVGSDPGPAALPSAGTATHNAKVRMRRYLSEFRDNHVETNRALSALVAATRYLRRGVKIHTVSPLPTPRNL